ncbi:GntR family transcriptional regulator [Paracoccus sp. S-4012]|uniref:GntR family transcriptional regulator n=1 Tax=Paracoccus sp. S-4012 TaxID=2665648 RepID=UPI0018A247D4|nr:GntR family transcriptional regulator [Paracoccus sp. S-4012]
MRQDVYELIRGLILAGEYISGDPMPEEQLAERLQVSRTPVREAMKRLQSEGIIERRENRRAYLAEVNPVTVVDIFMVRARLEPMAAKLAASRVDEGFLAALEARIAEMETARLAAEPDLRLYRQANEGFHWAILKQSGSGALDSTVRSVARRRITSPTFRGWTAEELERSQSHHRELLAAFRLNDPDWAEAVMTAHLHAARATYFRLSGLASGRASEDD